LIHSALDAIVDAIILKQDFAIPIGEVKKLLGDPCSDD
jgi:hypothetical protein